MPTSGVTAWSLTAREHVTTALQDARVISLGEEPAAEELAACLRRFNGMLKSWARASSLWLEQTVEVTITGGDGSLALDAGIKDVISARVSVSATHERPLARWERDEYYILSNK